ncbi:MAG: hypothetical protein KAI84_15145 [Gammaproteobacteria bacterium]|nr:hypothetical protein [Gammaproteobacteria bacterium]
MMRIIKKSYEKTIENYQLISEFEQKYHLKSEIEKGLCSIFLISQNLPLKDVADFFSGENFSLMESFEELETSYELVKFGFYKQSMISLRVAFDIGLLSIYWSIVGKESEEFKKWVSSEKDTPYKNKQFWKIYKSNDKINAFNKKYGLIQEIKDLRLSDFVHTKGILFSNFGEFQRKIQGQDKFESFKKWLGKFKKIVKILEVLHLLKFPTLNLIYSTDFLISKFGTFDSIPQFGGGHGDEMDCVFSFIPEEQKQFIKILSNKDNEVKEVIDWLDKLPDLTDEEIKNIILVEEKRNIELNGWENSANFFDNRIDSNMMLKLKEWAERNNLMTIDAILENRRNAKKTHNLTVQVTARAEAISDIF